MANRTTFSHLSSPPVPGGGPTGFAAEYSQRMKQLFDACALPLTAIGGTANALTATLDPVLDGSGLVDGMKFTLTFGATNTGGMTLAINGGTALALLDKDGAALVAGAVVSGMRAMVEYIGGAFRVLTEIKASAASGQGPYFLAITASTTWNKPAGYPADTMVRVQAWGGGGGGANHASDSTTGGGGGSYVERFVRYADVPANVVCTIGPGGAVSTNGGDTSFGALLTAYGGERGITSGGGGGRAGGELASGQNGGAVGGGAANGGNAGTIWGGGSGGAQGTPGGRAVFGGGGGGSRNNLGTATAGGASLYGGNGGAGASGAAGAGAAPGGGGGSGSAGAAGARGEIRITIFG